jgi:phosphoglycerol transferase MdoB-like AlkP superfamily enzyme
MNSYLTHLKLLIKKIGIVFFIFSLCRVLFYLFNSQHFNDVSFGLFFYGLRFDLVAISFIFSPLIILHILPFPFRSRKWYNQILSILFYVLTTISVAINLIDVAYFDFTLKRTTSDFFGMISTGNDFFNLLPHYIIDFWYNYILFFILLSIAWLLHSKCISQKNNFQPYNLKIYFFHTLIFILFSGVSVIGMRGGFQYMPIDIINAGQYAKAQNIPIVLNTPFTIIKTVFADKIELVSYYSEEEIETVYTPKTKIKGSRSQKGKNVVLIILESFAKEYVGGYNNGNGFTPFIDSLLNDSYVFNNAYANGSRSIESLPCILAGIPQLMPTPYTLSNYSGNQIQGLPQLLKKEGYNTSFYHGGANGTMGFNGFVGAVGIDNYFGLNEYPNNSKDYDNYWGIFDEPYLQYYASELNSKNEPFFSTLFTVSSHDPYTIPKEHFGKFPKGDLPLHETVGYTDYSLRLFFEKAEKMSWFNNTIFVFTADHSVQSNSAKYKTSIGRYAVPLFIYDPTGNLKGLDSTLVQHIDISPTILDLVGGKNSIISFGNSAFNNNDKFVIQYANGAYQITTEDNFLIFDGEITTEFYYLKSDSLLTNNFVLQALSDQCEDDKQNIEKKLKGIIQQYNNRLINNQLSTSNQQSH